MKILINTDQIYLHGGIEKVMATKVNYWADLPGVTVFIVTTEQNEQPPCYPINPKVKLIDLGINYNRSRSYFSKSNLVKAVQHYFRQKKMFKELQPDVVLSPNFNFDHYWLPFIKQKAKLIKERHGSRYLEPVRRQNASLPQKIKFRVDDWIDSQYDHIVVLNDDEKNYVRPGNGVVIPNPIALSELRADVSKKQVIAAGRISPVKGFDHLIKAWAMVQPAFTDWQLHIYGQDYLDTQSKLQEQIDSLGLHRSILFKANVDDLPNTMTDYSIYAMTSETECFPMVLLEALSVGLPVISYDAPTGPKHIITHDSDSVLIPYNNSAIFAEQLKKLMSDKNLRKQMGARAKINTQRFEISKVMDQWKKLFEQL